MGGREAPNTTGISRSRLAHRCRCLQLYTHVVTMGLITIQSQGTTNDVKGRFQLLWHEVQNCFQILEYNVIPNIIIITFSKKKKKITTKFHLPQPLCCFRYTGQRSVRVAASHVGERSDLHIISLACPLETSLCLEEESF
jgi:hypothetical protein